MPISLVFCLFARYEDAQEQKLDLDWSSLPMELRPEARAKRRSQAKKRKNGSGPTPNLVSCQINYQSIG